jgi:hypothetical protein
MAAPEPWLDRLKMPQPSYQPAFYGPAEEEIYGRVIDILQGADVPFLLAGAFALNVHTGIWRSTKDLDFFVAPEDLEPAYRALEAQGYRIEVVDRVWLSKAWRDGVFVDFIHANANGLFPVSRDWFQHAKEHLVFGRKVLVASAEDVILSKMFVASRERFDGADILHFIYALKGRLDWKRMLAKAGEHAGLLLGYLHHFQYAYPVHANYIPEAVFREAERLALEGRAGAMFRGRLLDPTQFTVDVDTFGLEDGRAVARDAAAHGPDHHTAPDGQRKGPRPHRRGAKPGEAAA